MKFVFSQSVMSVVPQKWARTVAVSGRLADLVHALVRLFLSYLVRVQCPGVCYKLPAGKVPKAGLERTREENY